MILKNKLTKETLDIPYSEFRQKFAKEIQDAFKSFKRTELNKTFYNFKDDNIIETHKTKSSGFRNMVIL